MRLRLYKMTPQGMIATANMLLCVIVLLSQPHLLPIAKGWLYAILRMPLVFLFPVHTGPPEIADVLREPLLIIANACLWGHVMVWLWRRTIGHVGTGKMATNRVLHAALRTASGADSCSHESRRWARNVKEYA